MRSQTKSFDVRLSTAEGVFSVLIEAMDHDEAKSMALANAGAKGHADVSVQWCVEYPPHRRVLASRAITD
jgi:hypothetical protein